MEDKISSLEWKKNPVYIAGGITAVFIIIVSLFYSKINQNLQIAGIVLLLVAGGVTFLFYYNQCPKCKRIFNLKKISDEVIKEWEEPHQYQEKTIYYYSDGITQKDVKNGETKTFIARFEKHKEGYNCKKCNEISHRIKDVFLNKNDWIRAKQNAIHRITTNIRKPKEHHTNINMDFDLGSFEPTTYTDRSGKRKSIPKKIKMDLWNRYFGKGKAYGKCFVCGDKIHTHHFEAGHVVPASKGGGESISNLRPICFGCNRSMGNRNLYEYKQTYKQRN